MDIQGFAEKGFATMLYKLMFFSYKRLKIVGR